MMKRYTIVIALLLMLGLGGVAVQVTQAQEFGSGWTGRYYNNTNFSGDPVFTRLDSQINFNFGTGSPVAGFVNADNFSIRWSGLQTLAAGTYRFFGGADDGIRVTVNGQVVIDRLVGNGTFQITNVDVQVPGGTIEIIVEYVETEGNAAVQFYWEAFNVGPTPTAGPTATATATGLPPIPPGAISATVIRASVLNTRDAPTLGGNVVGRILRGQTYQVVGRNENATWFLLQLNNRQAWAWGYYLFINGNEFTPPISSVASTLGLPGGVQDTGVVAQTRAAMRMRAEPNLSSPQTGRITWGAFLPVVGRTAAGDWYQVVWKNTVGWVFTGFLDIRYGDLNNVPIR